MDRSVYVYNPISNFGYRKKLSPPPPPAHYYAVVNDEVREFARSTSERLADYVDSLHEVLRTGDFAEIRNRSTGKVVYRWPRERRL